MRLHCYYRQFSGRVDHSINFISVIFALVHAFVSSRLDYCNSLLYGVSDELLQKLRSERGRTSCDGTKEIRPSRCFANFTGCPSANALWSSTSVSMCWRHRIWLTTVYWSLFCGQQTVLEIGGHSEAGRSAKTNCYWRQRFRGLQRCHLELATYRSASLVTVCGDVCQTTESLLVSSPELAHLRTV